MPKEYIQTHWDGPARTGSVHQPLPAASGGPIKLAATGGNWLFVEFNNRTIQASLPLDQYDGAFTNNVDSCYAIALLYRSQPWGDFERMSLAHANGGNLEQVDWESMFANMPQRGNIHVAAGTGEWYGATNARLLEILGRYGVRPDQVTVYGSRPNQTLSGFGVHKNGRFGECSHTGPVGGNLDQVNMDTSTPPAGVVVGHWEPPPRPEPEPEPEPEGPDWYDIETLADNWAIVHKSDPTISQESYRIAEQLAHLPKWLRDALIEREQEPTVKAIADLILEQQLLAAADENEDAIDGQADEDQEDESHESDADLSHDAESQESTTSNTSFGVSPDESSRTPQDQRFKFHQTGRRRSGSTN